MAGYLWDDSDSGGHKYFSRKNLSFFDEEIGKSFIELSGSGYNPGTMDWVSTTVEQTKDNSGNPVAGSYQITVGSSSKVKIDLSCNKTRVGGTATLSYWDKNANSGKGSWVQNGLYCNISINEDGVVEVNQTDSNYEEILTTAISKFLRKQIQIPFNSR